MFHLLFLTFSLSTRTLPSSIFKPNPTKLFWTDSCTVHFLLSLTRTPKDPFLVMFVFHIVGVFGTSPSHNSSGFVRSCRPQLSVLPSSPLTVVSSVPLGLAVLGGTRRYSRPSLWPRMGVPLPLPHPLLHVCQESLPHHLMNGTNIKIHGLSLVLV